MSCQFKINGGHLTRHFISDILAPDGPLNLSTNIKESEDQDSNEDGDKLKKPRTSFSGWQIYELERLFEEKKYINNEERKTFSNYLGVSAQQVKVWFQNRRTKWKREENIPNETASQLMKSLR